MDQEEDEVDRGKEEEKPVSLEAVMAIERAVQEVKLALEEAAAEKTAQTEKQRNIQTAEQKEKQETEKFIFSAIGRSIRDSAYAGGKIGRWLFGMAGYAVGAMIGGAAGLVNGSVRAVMREICMRKQETSMRKRRP